jgi:hypothetical protein
MKQLVNLKQKQPAASKFMFLILILYTEPNGLNSSYNGNNKNNTLLLLFSFCPHLTLLLLDACRMYEIIL